MHSAHYGSASARTSTTIGALKLASPVEYLGTPKSRNSPLSQEQPHFARYGQVSCRPNGLDALLGGHHPGVRGSLHM